MVSNKLRIAIPPLVFLLSLGTLAYKFGFPLSTHASDCYQYGFNSIGPACVNAHCAPPTGFLVDCITLSCQGYAGDDFSCEITCDAGAGDFSSPYLQYCGF